MSILTKLAGESRKIVENNFDHTRLRTDIVQKKSMFKTELQLKEIFSEEKILLAKITG